MPNRAPRGCFLFADLLKPRRTQPNLRADPRSLRLLLFFDLLFVTLQGCLEVTDPFAQTFRDFGNFLAAEQQYGNTEDYEKLRKAK